MQRDRRIIAAILAADVVGYSRLMGADESGTLESLKRLRAGFEKEVAEFGGRVFGSVGDSLMAEFQSAVNAVLAALALQARVVADNAALPQERRMALRIGVNLGDVIEEQGGVFGDAVNVAARLQALAKPGGILISGAVHDQVRLKVAARYLDAGARRVKNIAEPVRSFEVLAAAPPGFAGRIAAAAARIASHHAARWTAVGAALVIALALGLFWREIPVPATGRKLGAILQPETVAPSNSLAVLPFANMTGNPANDYLGDGLAEELLNRLSRVPGLRVAARRSAFAYKGKDMDVRQIAEALGVNYVVEGSIRRQGEVVRVNAALVDRATGANRWSHSYESSGDIPAVEEDIGTQVLTALALVLESPPSAAAPDAPQARIAAYDYHLQGLSYLRRPKSVRTLEAAEQLFERSLAEEANFARAHAGLCQTRVERYLLQRAAAHIAAAEEACARAQALDDTAYEVHEAVGSLRLVTGDAAEAESAYRRALVIVPESPDALIGLAAALADEGDSAAAERTLQRAIAAQPRYVASHIEYGSFLLRQGRAQEAIEPYQRAALLEPDSASAFNNLGIAYLYAGNFEQATEAFSRSQAIEPRHSSYSNIGTGYYYRGRFADAANMFRMATELSPDDHRLWGNFADALLFDGRPDEARLAYGRALALADKELAVNPKQAYNQALSAYYSARLGNKEQARRRVESALSAAGNGNEAYLYVGLAELVLGDEASAARHVRRARELGYPEVFLKSAPELAAIRDEI
ncbi:MAG: tetratricopeptide repeat protein [Steroidobacteraceae bacterium]